ncbi:hypothetical protein D1871_19290 [Nakamurella silvestris]|nr:hypothetical protein D1871_19290 [Nakamurella silvestris]
MVTWASVAVGCAATPPRDSADGTASSGAVIPVSTPGVTNSVAEPLTIVPVGRSGLKVSGTVTLGAPSAGAVWTHSPVDTLDLMQRSAGRLHTWLDAASDVRLYLGSLPPDQASDLSTTDVVYLRLSRGTTCTADGVAGRSVEPTPVACTIGVLVRASDGSGLETVEGAY